MPTIRGEIMKTSKLVPFACALAIGSLTCAVVNAATPVVQAPEASQQAVLALINNLAQSRAAGRGLLEADLRAKTQIRNEAVVDGRTFMGDTSVGPVKVSSSIGPAGAEDTDLVMRFSGACVHREFVREHLQLKDVVWTSPPDDPAPTIGYAYFTGGSAVTLFFDATGTRCLTAVRMEPEAVLRQQLQRSRSTPAHPQSPG